MMSILAMYQPRLPPVHPETASTDSQSGQTMEGLGRIKGDDRSKQVTGQHRHLPVDMLGLLPAAVTFI